MVGSLASLHDGDESSIYILARNNTTHSVQVDSIVTIGPQFIEFEKSSAAGLKLLSNFAGVCASVPA